MFGTMFLGWYLSDTLLVTSLGLQVLCRNITDVKFHPHHIVSSVYTISTIDP